MKIAYIGTYPPRQCGIGTYTRNKFTAIIGNGAHEGMVIAINDNENSYDYPEEVQYTIRQDQQDDYVDAAKFINRSGADICVLEHEFGIFGGQNGVFILSLLYRLKIPIVAVYHTVLKSPSYNQKVILTDISRLAAKTVVMSHKAVEFLTSIYDISPEKIEMIEHGVPDLRFDQEQSKKDFNLENKKLLLTFGLIGRNKGIETVIKALPGVVAKHPEVVFIVLGKTHPAVLRHSGEEYRLSLVQMIEELQLEKHVLFMNEFVNEEELFKYLSAADIYVTPYLNEAQITSGTLSYAVGAGCAVISTPYWHAAELLAEDRGRLFDFNDHEQLSSIFMDLLDHPETRIALRKNALAFGRQITWPNIGERYIALAQTILQKQKKLAVKKEMTPGPVILPPFALDHIRRMTDDTGIIQHANFSIPNLKEGYCLDDNARALLMALMAYKQKKHSLAIELLPVYLSYIHYMQNEDGTFRNFMSFNRNFLDTLGSEDSFGRAIWALGYLLGNAPKEAYYQSAKEIFFKAAPNFENLQSVRGIANTIIGISHYLQNNPSHIEMNEQVRDLSSRLVQQYFIHSTAQWKWFEPVLTYDNALIPLSLLHAASVSGDMKIMGIALESMHFLAEITFKNDYLSVVGNEEWYSKDGKQSVFAQQPLDVMAMVLMFQKAFQLTKDKTYRNKMHTSFMWFLGENDLRISLYDYETKGCCDGLESYGINQNQGAESTLAYLISYLTILQSNEETYSSVRQKIQVKVKELTTRGIEQKTAV
jgi:glycosyltransferase involved in cell wall biosynthesis